MISCFLETSRRFAEIVIRMTKRSPVERRQYHGNGKSSGAISPLQKIAASTGLENILKKVFPESYEQILSIVYFIPKRTALYRNRTKAT
jgi:hypothetical protein